MKSILMSMLALSLASQNFDVALIGDMPYGTANEPRFERVIADINRTTVDFTIHIGDTKSGSTRCDNSHYTKVLSWFNSFDTALIYTPGDNEWTDCMRTNNGAFDPLDRLSMVRKTYYQNDQSLGRRPVVVQRQSADSQFSMYVENAMYVKGPVVFATIHAPGSNNNLEYKLVQGAANRYYDNDKEFAGRDAANVAWLRKAFQTARDNKSLGVLVAMQGNIFDGFYEEGTGATRSGFESIVRVLREEAKNFKGEIVVVNGDSHYMRIDKPMTDRYPGCTSATGDCKPFDAALDARGATVLNLTRVEVPGSANVHWTLLKVRPGSRNIFQFEFMIVPDAPTGAAVSASIAGPAALETNSPQVNLDGSKSTSPNSGDLTYSWSNAAGYPLASILNAASPTPTVQMPMRGEYQFVLTVTDRTGASAKTSVTVRYL